MAKRDKFANAYQVTFMDCNFVLGFSNKFDKDFFTVREILEKPVLTAADRMRLLTIYQPAYHKSGKIEDIMSFDSSGDIPNQVYAENMIKIASLHLNVQFAFWTKHAAALIAATDKLGKPANCIYILSSVLIGRAARLPKYFDYVFTVYPDKETTEKAIAAGAYECNGKKCKECGFSCYYGKFPAGANIAERLRGADKEKIAAIKEWLANN